MLNHMEVHGHDDLLAGLLLAVYDCPMLWIDVLPFQGNAIAETGAHEIPNENERLPFQGRRRIQEPLDLLRREDFALR